MTLTKKTAASVAVFATFIALAALNIVFYFDLIPLSDNGIDRAFTLVSQIVCMGLIPCIVFKALSPKTELVEHASLKPPKAKTVPAIIVIALMMLFINLTVAVINLVGLTLFGYKLPESAGTIYTGVGSLLLDLVLVAVLPALFEEFTFRGIVLGAYKDSPKVGIVLSALLFGLMHTNIMQFLYAFIGGLVLAAIVVKTRSIWASSIIHFSINAFGILRAYGAQHEESVINLLNKGLNYLFSEDMLLVFFGLVIAMCFAVVAILKRIDKRDPVDMRARGEREPLRNYAFTVGAVVFGGMMTVATLIWGIMR